MLIIGKYDIDSSLFNQESTIISNILSGITYEKYMKLKEYEKAGKIILHPKGDVDTINILGNPKAYGIDLKRAFSILEEDGKKIGASILYRFDNKKTLEEIIHTINNTC